MKLNRAFLLAALIISPATVFGADTGSLNSWVQKILKSTTISAANENLSDAKAALDGYAEYSGDKVSQATRTAADTKIDEAKANVGKDMQDVNPDDTRNADEKAADLQDKQDAYDEAKANEQSMANKTLTAVTTAATGLGAMELMQGLSEKNADENADQDMKSYIETFRCTYGQGKNVKAGPTEIELPGGNLPELMKLRNEYFTLATDLKERKTALGMKPGIESEEILDKSQMGLYDDEFVGITGGAYESLYRAQMLNSEEDQKKIDEAKDKSAKRVKYGAIALGAGAAVGIVGNSLINGKLGELIKTKKEKTELTEKDAKKKIPVERPDAKISKSVVHIQDFENIKAFALNNNECYFMDADGEYYKGASTEICKELKKGEWLAKFNYGIVKGKASCNNTEGNNYCYYYSQEQAQDSNCAQDTINRASFEKSNNTFDINSTGKNCWCQTINIGKTSSNWVYNNSYSSEQECAKECAYDCASYFGDGDNPEFAEEILSSTED